MTKDVKQVMAGKLQKLSVKVATHYANVACPDYYLPAKDECRSKET